MALINQQELGLPDNVFVSITLEHQDLADLRAFETAVKSIPEIMECYLMTGQYDFLLRVVVADVNDFERIHRRYLTRLPGTTRPVEARSSRFINILGARLNRVPPRSGS